MRATPWPEDCSKAPVLWQSQLSEPYATIHDLPTSELANQTELALVLLMNRSKKQILLQVPNTKLNWRYHFGCRWEDNDEKSLAAILESHKLAAQSLRKAGTMLFTFPEHDPMRVHVMEAKIDSATSQTGGKWTDFREIPYTEMWADDVLWLPWFVDYEGVEFEGHFIFDGNPGPSSRLVAHNCQRLN